jgi:uncharacterized 2Fe-2S/4Fe-4S cluster protein (DUF4445 family)
MSKITLTRGSQSSMGAPDRVIEVPAGTLLSQAIEQAGWSVSLPCGGQGRCGRCLVQVSAGSVRRRAVARLTPEEIEEGYALACQSVLEGDVTVVVPQQELGVIRAETVSAAEKVAPMVVSCDHGRAPWVDKYVVRIEPPSLADNTSDYERLQRELARQHGLRDMRSSLALQKKLATVLRQGDWFVTAVVERGTWIAPDDAPRLIDLLPGDATGRTLGLAVDIGTTGVVVYLADLRSGALLDHASAFNGQIACGEDVISRIIYARKPGGLEHLQRLVLQTINDLVDEILARQGLHSAELYLLVVAANTTMTHLFLGLDPQYIRLEPYIPTINYPLPVRAQDLGLHLHPEATVDCLPGVGAYVGGDITAGVLRSRMTEEDVLTLFIDVGTNGEIVLGNAEWLISCACSAGPAFEGAGVVSGMRATPGAIEEVWINRKTAEPAYRTIGNAPPRGICGSGMISLLGEMFITGVIDKSGHINRSLQTSRVRAGANGPEYVIVWAQESALGPNGEPLGDIVLTEADIQNLIRAKAAIYAGFTVLATSVGLQVSDVERILIGGAFGRYIDIEKAIQIGLLPDLPWERFSYLGNTSVQGATLSLLCREHRAQVAGIARKMTYLELSADNSFMEAFTSALFLPHTDLESFPSVAAVLRQKELQT